MKSALILFAITLSMVLGLGIGATLDTAGREPFTFPQEVAVRGRFPGGRLVSGDTAASSTSTRTCPVWGTSSAGLKITAFPHRSAGNIFHVGIASGKLNGVISPATPIGRR
mgnify:CR=1 FL=1